MLRLAPLLLPPVLVQVDREHQKQNEDDDPLGDVGERVSVGGEVGFVPAFEPVGVATCAQCHTGEGADASCVTCHDYHALPEAEALPNSLLDVLR